MAAAPTGELAGLIRTLHETSRTVQERFGPLSAAQLNWKPSPDRWSVAQCLDHLLATNAGFLPAFDAVLAGRHRPTLWQRMPWIPGVFGRLVRNAVHPDSAKAYKAGASFQPSASDVDAGIVARFTDQQSRLGDVLAGSAGLDLDRIVITSAVSPIVIYSLFDAFRIMVLHDQRHVRQAIRVTEAGGFPAVQGTSRVATPAEPAAQSTPPGLS
jgi:hypothetical protein